MPFRKVPIVTNEIYHVFNRGIDKRPTFTSKREYERAMQVVWFYHFTSPPVKLSRFLTLPSEDQTKITLEQSKKAKKLVAILSYCLMPNHYHFLLKQSEDNGISKFMSQFQNSYTKYFNTKHERTGLGALFVDQFKAVRIETDEQLLHVSRYIHLNPYTSYVVKDLESLVKYPWSSLEEYSNLQSEEICDTNLVLSFFKNRKEYARFVFDQADYQRTLDKIKHLLLEN